jgi:hypothetical protein
MLHHRPIDCTHSVRLAAGLQAKVVGGGACKPASGMHYAGESARATGLASQLNAQCSLTMIIQCSVPIQCSVLTQCSLTVLGRRDLQAQLNAQCSIFQLACQAKVFGPEAQWSDEHSSMMTMMGLKGLMVGG